ncbi:MAG: bifunctional UDP-N-acetylglucosamine diphosphorylase/glucosamine-1-phosphate N-acetyltransferase GlmU [Gammaproteobacteria bacterium]
MSLEIIILAAGKGTRMYSDRPKVLHEIGGRPMLAHVIQVAHALQPDHIHVVVGFGGDEVRATTTASFPGLPLNFVSQTSQLGTGHAVLQALPFIAHTGPGDTVLVLYGDVPLIRQQTLQALLNQAGPDSLQLLTLLTENPQGLGRIVRDGDSIKAIVEEKDCDDLQLSIQEINSGIMLIPANHLSGWLDRIGKANVQGEYYLTDIVAMAVNDGVGVNALVTHDEVELQGVNNKAQLAQLERHYQMRTAKELLEQGTTLRDPSRIDIRGELQCGQGVEIDINVLFEGKVSIGNASTIGANCIISNSTIGDNVKILAGSNIDGAEVETNAVIGPNARLRPGTVVREGAKIGNFVETKNAVIGKGSKANHLAYIGDAEIGEGCNIGAGTIFCNYDGANKHKTTLGNNVFIGSNSVLVAPVTLADNAFVAAGSAINTDVPADTLAVARGKQRNISGWKRPVKK